MGEASTSYHYLRGGHCCERDTENMRSVRMFGHKLQMRRESDCFQNKVFLLCGRQELVINGSYSVYGI